MKRNTCFLVRRIFFFYLPSVFFIILYVDRRGEPKQLYNSRGKKHLVGTKTIEQVLSCDNTLFLDFIQQCLQWDPEKRLTPEKAFQHDWILSKV